MAALAGLVPLVLLAVPAAIAPTAATTGDVPAGMAAAYRGFVVFGQATLWFVLASAHAWLGTPGPSPEASSRVAEESIRAD